MPSQTLSLSQSQSLQMVLAPQLRQSLEMLQLPILELRAMIQQEIEQNPTIEDIPVEGETIEIEPGEGKTETAEEMEFEKEFEALAKLDEEWRDYFFQNLQNNPYTQEAADRRQFLMDSQPQQESLQEHLLGQLNLSGLSAVETQLGELIVGSINDDGYMTMTPEELAESVSADPEAVHDVLNIIREFHPCGVGAHDLSDCLLLQMEKMDTPHPIAEAIVRDHLTKLGGRKYPLIARALKISQEEVHAAAEIISKLDPKPGRIYSSELAPYILPEVVVEKIEGEYVIVLNDDQLPHIRVSRHYRQLLKDAATTSDVKSYIRERVRSGAFLIKSIHQRQKTIHRVAEEIVRTQTEFLDHGVSHLKPLTMAEVAGRLDIHETTVSRAVSAKYMKTPGGIYEMKYFFTPGIKTADGGQVSNKTVKDMIASLVAREDPAKPLSDQAIVTLVEDKGIKIARRTVAKYRLVLKIPPSHMRKGY